MDRFYRISAVSPETAPGDFPGNLKALEKSYREATKQGASAVVFPAYAVCGDPCGDLARRADFLDACRRAAEKFAALTGDGIAVFGTLWSFDGRTAGAAVVARNGRIVSVIPEKAAGNGIAPQRLRFDAGGFTFAVAVGEIDGSEPDADALFWLGADAFSAEAPGRRATLATGYSALRRNAVVFANAGSGLANTDHVGDGETLISCEGKIVGRGVLFAPNCIFADIDFGRIAFRRGPSGEDAEIVRIGKDAVASPDFKFASLVREPFFEEAGNDLPQ
ncbi:MAG: hypothetical protein MJ016_06805, partial [Victivallaceae bacterium]|nr:hypothetical protein [Victivallaceae bacterium]